jgi:hypothetical protein
MKTQACTRDTIGKNPKGQPMETLLALIAALYEWFPSAFTV